MQDATHEVMQGDGGGKELKHGATRMQMEEGRESPNLGMGDTCAPTQKKVRQEAETAAKILANASARAMPPMREQRDGGDDDGGEVATAADSNAPPKAV